MSVILETNIIEDKKLSLRTEIDSISNTGKFKIAFCSTAYTAWIKPVSFFGNGINYVGDQTQSLFGHKRIDPVTIGIGNEEHVRLVNRGPAAQARTIEAEPLLKRFF